jgi:hypothetical protein
MKMAHGEILGYLNSDDLYLPHTLHQVANHFMQNPSTQWCTGDYFVINHEGKKIQTFVVEIKKILRIFLTFNLLVIANSIIQPSTFWRKSFAKKIGRFDDQLRYCMDYDYWLKCIQIAQPYIFRQPLSLFRVHADSKSGAQFQKQFAEEHVVVKRYVKNPVLITLHKCATYGIMSLYLMFRKV